MQAQWFKTIEVGEECTPPRDWIQPRGTRLQTVTKWNLDLITWTECPKYQRTILLRFETMKPSRDPSIDRGKLKIRLARGAGSA